MTDNTHSPTILWLGRDLRLSDHPGWQAALSDSGPVIPVFIRDPLFDEMTGAASAWRMGRALESLAQALEAQGSQLILRRGDASETLESLIEETGARRVVWGRAYDNRRIDRDQQIEAALTARGIAVECVNTSLLFEPWTVTTGTGGYYRVYTPYWRTVCNADVAELVPTPANLAPPSIWPSSDRLADWELGAEMRRGAGIVARHVAVGEDAALAALNDFIGTAIDRYHIDRDVMGTAATANLSAHLACGEISPVRIWHTVRDVALREPAEGAEAFLRQIIWREFAYHLLYHAHDLETQNFKPDWNDFPWRDDNPDAELWRRGMTGIDIVDAAMREMYVTGIMHNRCRMLTGSILTRHLMTHWRVGEAWFRECLIDWDVASNAMGWQWVSGAGPDAVPYFRIFNPETQAAKFDPDRRYRDRWLAEERPTPHEDALSYFDAVPESWSLSPRQSPPPLIVSQTAGRERALAAFADWRERRADR